MSWLIQFRVSPHAIPPWHSLMRPVEPPLSVVATMPVALLPKSLSAARTRPKP